MQKREKLLKEGVKRLLDGKQVELVIGYEKGTLALRTTPSFITSADDVERLVWNEFCENNLAKYLPGRKEKVAIVAKGCDVRSIVGLIQEGQITREQIFIIGIPCEGIIDRRKIESRLGKKEILEAACENGKILLRGEDFQEILKKDDFLYDSCKVCKYRNPIVFDLLIGDRVPESGGIDEYAEIREFEAKSADERWLHFQKEISKCIRCYACRNACPLCYCEWCLVDQSQPRWIGVTDNPSDVGIFHLFRVFHVAGRCVDCGACSRACPMNIDLRWLLKKMEKDVKELFGYEAGLSVEEVPPLATFKEEDPQDFIK